MQGCRASLAGLVELLVVTTGCNQIGGIYEGIPRDAGATVICAVVEDCEFSASVCHSAVACEAGECVFNDSIQSPCICVPGDIVPCYTGTLGTESVGLCHGGTRTCNSEGLAYGPCNGQRIPQPETCDAGENDEDCDGQVNEEGANCTCGDGYISSTEECDDENLEPTDLCSPACKLSVCGDGTVQPALNETCDDGNLDPTDLCSPTCKLSVCGDGTVQPALNETCDDAGTLDGDACSPTCREQRVLDVSGGYAHTCAVLSEGTLKCWGFNVFGKLGLGDTSSQGDQPNEMGANLPAVNVGVGEKVVAVGAGSYHTCALLSDGRVKCWGHNVDGQLGSGDTSDRGDGPDEMGTNLPAVNFGSGKTAIAIAAGSYHTCALLSDGNIKCWGNNVGGQLGLGDTSARGDDPGEMGDNLPSVDLGTSKTAVAIGLGSFYTCALLNDSSVKCWGISNSGQLGLGDSLDRGDEPNEMGNNLPALNLGEGKTVVAISVNGQHACALLNDGGIKCWGDNTYGQLGLGDTSHRGDDPNEMGDKLAAVSLGAGKTGTAVQTGYSHTCALLSDGTVKCWGYNNGGVLGLGVAEHKGDGPNEMGDSLPGISLGAGRSVTAIHTGTYHTCVRFFDGSLKCWGKNGNGELGLGNVVDCGANLVQMGDNLPTVKLFSNMW